MFFRRKTTEELAAKLKQVHDKRISTEGRASIRKRIQEEKTRTNKAIFGGRGGGVLSAGKAVLKGLDKVGRHMAENMEEEEQANRKKRKGMFGY